ncbi:MAG: YkgJ family cysteine cluster protein [archaeon]
MELPKLKECRGCDKHCCRGGALVTLADAERVRSAACKLFGEELLLKDIVNWGWYRPQLEIKTRKQSKLVEEKDRYCLFFSKGRCRIYKEKPLSCSLFPFIVNESVSVSLRCPARKSAKKLLSRGEYRANVERVGGIIKAEYAKSVGLFSSMKGRITLERLDRLRAKDELAYLKRIMV